MSDRELSALLRALKLGLIALTLMSVGVVGGLLLSTSIQEGRPEPTSTMAAAHQSVPAGARGGGDGRTRFHRPCSPIPKAAPNLSRARSRSWPDAFFPPWSPSRAARWSRTRA